MAAAQCSFRFVVLIIFSDEGRLHYYNYFDSVIEAIMNIFWYNITVSSWTYKNPSLVGAGIHFYKVAMY